MKKCKLFLIIILIAIILISTSSVIPVKVYAQETTNYESYMPKIENSKKNENEENYSEEYKRYLALSEEEKSKIEVIPRKYNIPLDSIYENTKTVKESPTIWNAYGLFAKSTVVSENAEEIPEKFDLRDKINIKVENQKNYGLCWDFASMTSLETYLSLNGYGDFDFSELHVDYLMSKEFGEGRDLHEGGNFSYFIKYLKNNYGPVSEEKVPYDAEYTIDDYEYLLNLEQEVFLEESIDFPTISKRYKEYTQEELNLFRSKVKNHIIKNGSIYAYIDANPFYFTENSTIVTLYNGDKNQTIQYPHAISIIGWDDNFSKENFKDENGNIPQKDGAYIALNSWGEKRNSPVDDGTFYISYEDIYVESQMSGIAKVSNKKEDVYQTIQFKDVNLYNAMKEILGRQIISFNDSNLTIEVSKLIINTTTSLNLSKKNITDLSGIEKFSKLSSLDLFSNNIKNITPICSLEKLNSLSLNINNISELEGIEKLSNLEFLNISNNNIQEIEKLKELANLISLNIAENEISNIDIVNNLTNLSEIIANKNNIETLNITSLKRLNCLNLSDNPIKDISSLKNFEYIDSLYLDNTKIEDVSVLSNIAYLSISNSNYPIPDGLNKLKLYSLKLNNCSLEDEDLIKLKDLYCVNISLKDNNLSNVSELKNVDGHFNSIDLSGNKNLDLNSLPLEKVMVSLVLDNCNISNVSKLKNFLGVNLTLSNNPIEDISELKDMNLDYICLDNTKINTKINLPNATGLSLNNCNISNIEEILGDLANVNDLSLDNNNITNIDVLNKYSNLISISLENNKITDITSLSNIYNKEYYYLNLKNNSISEIPEKIYSHYSNIFEGQNVTKEFEIVINEDNKFELPSIVSLIYKNRYKSPCIIKAENCEIDYKNNQIVLKSNSLQDGKATIKINGGKFDGSTITFNYNVVEDRKISKLEVYKKSDKCYYLEGTDFDSTGLELKVTYENGACDFITDYELENDKNLEKGQESITIKYKGFEIKQPISVFGNDQVTKIKFNDINFYEYIKSYISRIDSRLDADESSILIDNKGNKELVVLKNIVIRINDITDLDDSITDLKGIESFSNLISLKIPNNIVDISCIEYLPNLISVAYYGTNISVFDNFSNFNKLQSLTIFGGNRIDEVEYEGNTVVIPQILKKLKEEYNCNLKAYVREKNGENTISEVEVPIYFDDNNNLVVDIDTKITEERPYVDRELFLCIKEGFAGGTRYIIEYNTSCIKDSKFDTTNINGKKYITELNDKNNTVQDVINKTNFPTQRNIIKTFNKEGKELEQDKKLGTNSYITLINKANQNEINRYYIALKGDIDCNGEVEIYDILQLIDIVFDRKTTDDLDDGIKLAANCLQEDEEQKIDIYDILRLIEYEYDNVEW